MNYIKLYFFIFLSCCSNVIFATSPHKEHNDSSKHVKAFYEKGKYAGWPANWGIWCWENEILVGFTYADHKDKRGHTFDGETAINKFVRSKDGGITWQVEDAYEHGIVESTVEHKLHNRSISATDFSGEMDFTDPNFGLTFRMKDMYYGPSSFYYTYDRGQKWTGPYKLNIEFPQRSPAGIVTRTDYIIESKHEMTAFLTVGFTKEKKTWREVACVRTVDGGKSWKFLSWVGTKNINGIMPASVRLNDTDILVLIRETKPARMTSFISQDNGYTWSSLPDPVKVDSNGNPPALVKLRDGRLCLVYGIREKETMKDGIGMYVTYSSDNGKTWDKPALLRGGDGACWDIGYPRLVQTSKGQLVALYYYNNVDNGDKYRYIAATIFDPK